MNWQAIGKDKGKRIVLWQGQAEDDMDADIKFMAWARRAGRRPYLRRVWKTTDYLMEQTS